MLYHLLFPLHDQYSVFNVFRYISFRSIYSILTALAIALVMGPIVIRWLKAKKIGEKIRNDGPQTHLSKEGTPTMGGLLIFMALVIPTFLWADIFNSYIWVSLITVTLFAAIGFYDDYMKLTGIRSGMSGKTKLAYQFSAALIIVLLIYLIQGGDPSVTKVHIPFLKDVQQILAYYTYLLQCWLL